MPGANGRKDGSMRIFQIAAISLMALGATVAGSVSAAAQSDEPGSHKKVFGYEDAQTGVFHPLDRAVAETTTAPVTGTFELTITVTLKTAVPAGGSVLCSTDITAASTSLTTGTAEVYTETAYSVAKVTGSTATCTVTTPYSWVITPSSTTVENLLEGSHTVSILAAPSTTINAANIEGRSSSTTFLNSKTIPASGTTSKYTANVTL